MTRELDKLFQKIGENSKVATIEPAEVIYFFFICCDKVTIELMGKLKEWWWSYMAVENIIINSGPSVIFPL